MEYDAFSFPKRMGANGDRYASLVFTKASSVFLIADGVGSTSQPGVAAELVVNHALNVLRDFPDISMEKLFTGVKMALNVAAEESETKDPLQSTLTVCKVDGEIARIGHVGDSRLYHIRGEGIETRTKDQTEVQRLLDEGVLSPIRAKKYPRSNVLLSVLASNRDYELFESSFEIREGDRISLVTDGLYKVVSKRQFSDCSLNARSVIEFCDCLRQIALATALTDDATVLAVQF